MAHYLKSMSGASPHFGTAALRFSSDIVAWRDSGGGMRREKLPMLPGNRWMGIVCLFSSANGEFLRDHERRRSAALSRRRRQEDGVATKYLARGKMRESVGLIGSGWQAGTQVMAVCEARTHQKKIKVFSPTKANREKFARETSEQVGIEIVSVDLPGSRQSGGHRHHIDELTRAVSWQMGSCGREFISAPCSATNSTMRRCWTCKPSGVAHPCHGKQCHLVGARALRAGRLQIARSSDGSRHRLGKRYRHLRIF